MGLTFTACGTTTLKTIRWATGCVLMIARSPRGCGKKAALIRMVTLAAAKCGTQAVHVGGAAVGPLQAAIIDAVCHGSTKRSPSLVFVLCSHGEDIDPERVFVAEKLILLRRVMAEGPSIRAVVNEFISMSSSFGFVVSFTQPGISTNFYRRRRRAIPRDTNGKAVILSLVLWRYC